MQQPAKAQALKEAGLSRITVSLDGLHQDIFPRMTGTNVQVATMLAGIVAAQRDRPHFCAISSIAHRANLHR
ncbi:MAG: hypothetical protein PHI11_14180 [Gallionella sp.]|nr:hypothetical protein [Gallionella sp.]